MGTFNIPGTLSSIRRTKAGIELATVRLVNPKGDRSVTVIGVQHLATPEVWAQDIATLRKLEASGAKLFLEGVRPAEGKLTPEEERRVAAFNALGKAQRIFAEVTGLTHQKDAFAEAKASWPSYDVSVLEVARAVKPRTIRSLERMAKMNHEDLRDSPEFTLGLLRLLPYAPIFLNRLLSWDLSRQILDRRNEYAVDGVLKSTADHRVLYWGAAHLPGMVKLLRSHGYGVIAEDWRVVLPASYRAPASSASED